MIKYICDNCNQEFEPEWEIPERQKHLKGFIARKAVSIFNVWIDNISYPIQKEFCSKDCALEFFEKEKYCRMKNEYYDLEMEKPICV